MNAVSAVITVLAAGLVGAQSLFSLFVPAQPLLRPPGCQGEEDFLSRCITCGKCIEACPYRAVRPASIAKGVASGTPIINPGEQACRLCEDFPCVRVCPTGALRDVTERRHVAMGTAVIDPDLCIAIKKAIRCEVCYRTCPLIDQAISIEFRRREGDDIHAVFAPVINAESCVGCGLCAQRCVVQSPIAAIKIEAKEA